MGSDLRPIRLLVDAGHAHNTSGRDYGRPAAALMAADPASLGEVDSGAARHRRIMSEAVSACAGDDQDRPDTARRARRPRWASPDSSRQPIRVVVADDAYLIREFLAALLSSTPGVELAAVCSNGNELRRAIAGSQPDVVITDTWMPPLGAEEGIRVATSLRQTHPTIGVVVLSAHAEPTCALGLFEGGTARRAYLLKERVRNKDELIGAIEKVAQGGSVIDPLVVDALVQARSRKSHSRLAPLTSREREVLAEIAAGKSNTAIAASLVVTKRAVEKHVNMIFSKLDLTNADDVSRRVKAALIFLDERDDDTNGPLDLPLVDTPPHREDRLRGAISLPTAMPARR